MNETKEIADLLVRLEARVAHLEFSIQQLERTSDGMLQLIHEIIEIAPKPKLYND